jgi:hypothetical protein
VDRVETLDLVGQEAAGEASPGHHDHATWRHPTTSAESRLPHTHAEIRLRTETVSQESRLQIG